MRRISLWIIIVILILLNVGCTSDKALKNNTIPSRSTEDNSLRDTGSDGIFQFTITENEIQIEYVNHYDGNITVPEEIQNLVVTEIGSEAFYQNNCTSVDLPSTLRSIQSAAFYRCGNIKDITIPAGTEFIAGNPFFRCSGLEHIYVQQGNANYRDINGVLYNSTATMLIAYPEGRSETVYEIPEGVTQIADAAFGYDAPLESVVIPESVVDFPEYNLFETYEHISFVVVPGSSAERYASEYGIPVEYAE